MPAPLHFMTIADLAKGIAARTVSPVELTKALIARVAALDGMTHAFIEVTADLALAQAKKAEAEVMAGISRGPLHGVPVGLKDIIDLKGVRTTAHSHQLIDNWATDDAFVTQKLKAAGAVILGKLATHEFAMGGPSFDLPFPPARNPWNLAHFTGGSSSGSGAAVAAGYVPAALGTDTGGSIRLPAAFCGIVGMKPTYGLVSRRGVFPLSYTLDHCGPLSWTVEDSAITMEVIAGHDPLDPASADVPAPDFRSGLDGDVSGLKIALPRHFFAQAEGVSPEVLAAIDNAASLLAKAGAIVEEVTIPDYELFNAVGRVIMFSEAFAIHEKDYRERPLDFGRLTFTRMILGATLSAADLTQAYRLRRELAVAVNHQLLKQYDAILCASALAPAARFDSMSDAFPPNWPIQTMPFNVTGNPAMSMPAGFSASGLPLSVQIVGRPFDEPTVLRVGASLEKALALTGLRPSTATLRQAA